MNYYEGMLQKMKVSLKKNGISRKQLGDLIELSEVTVNNILNQKQEMRLPFLTKISEALGVHPCEWFYESESYLQKNDVLLLNEGKSEYQSAPSLTRDDFDFLKEQIRLLNQIIKEKL